jgi:hypothetical protein
MDSSELPSSPSIISVVLPAPDGSSEPQRPPSSRFSFARSLSVVSYEKPRSSQKIDISTRYADLRPYLSTAPIATFNTPAITRPSAPEWSSAMPLTAGESVSDEIPSIRKCRITNETEGEITHRLRLIVDVQTRYYGKRFYAEWLIGAAKNYKPVPEWLNTEFLFRLNYGEATQTDVRIAQRILKSLSPSDKARRLKVTLLDRDIANILYKHLFVHKADKNPFVDSEENSVNPGGPRTTPCDYPDGEEFEPLVWLEDFIIKCVWSAHYASPILGASRPPMVAIAADIISLIDYFSSPSLPRLPVTHHLRRWCKQDALCSIDGGLDESRLRLATRGFFMDLFRIAIARRYSDEGLDANHDPSGPTRSQLTMENLTQFPGFDVLRLYKVPLNAGKDQEGYSLDDIKASFIHSGPYKLELTTIPGEHLTVNGEGKIRVFWEGPWKGSDKPGHSFRKYESHTLGK